MLFRSQHTLTLSDDAVLGVMGQPDMRALLGPVGADGGTRMVCLERSSGKVRWIANPNELPNNPGNARNLSFSGSPLVVGDQVYVIARGSSGAGVEDCHLFCYDLPSGKYRWNCYVASSQVAGMAVGQPAMLSNDPLVFAPSVRFPLASQYCQRIRLLVFSVASVSSSAK